MQTSCKTLCAAIALLAMGSAAFADVTLTDTEHFSGGGGVWNDSNSGNWAIWYALNSDPSADPTRPFLNEPNPLGHNITIPEGTHTYALYKEDYNTTDVSTVFHFSNGVTAGAITINGGGNPYQTNSGPVPATPGNTLTLGATTISIDSFGWYDPSVFSKDFVGPNQKPNPSGKLDDIGLLSITVNTVPEPSSLALLGVGLVGLALAARRRRK